MFRFIQYVVCNCDRKCSEFQNCKSHDVITSIAYFSETGIIILSKFRLQSLRKCNIVNVNIRILTVKSNYETLL